MNTIVPSTDEVRAWFASRVRGQAVRIAVIDSGIDFTVLQNESRSGDSYSASETEVSIVRAGDHHGHGTAVADIIGRRMHNATIDSIRVTELGTDTKSQRLVTALSWAARQRYSVVNVSLSIPNKPDSLLRAIEELQIQNTAVVAAYSGTGVRRYPWALSNVISVAAHERHINTIERSNRDLVDFEAGGYGVLVPRPGEERKLMRVYGHSFACASVAGTIGRVMELFPGLRIRDYIALMENAIACSPPLDGQARLF